MKNKVFFIDFTTEEDRSIFQKMDKLFKKARLAKVLRRDSPVGIKLHLGEDGTTTYIKPIFVRKIVEFVEEYGAMPFLTDTNALYHGKRMDAVSHLKLAARHGFTFAPIIIADGLKGESYVKIKIKGKHLKEVQIASIINEIDSMIVVSHFTGHMVTGFGGAIKNIGMGCCAKEGKMFQHSIVSPYVEEEDCTGCGRCVKCCPTQAISVNEKASISGEKCIGCAMCISVCPSSAIQIDWDNSSRDVQEKMVEYALGAVKNKKVAYISFLCDITSYCDCYPSSEDSIVPDIGILVSMDPVAIDQASFDLVNKAKSLKKLKRGAKNKFKGLFPDTEPEVQLEYGEKLGLGTRNYELIKVE